MGSRPRFSFSLLTRKDSTMDPESKCCIIHGTIGLVVNVIDSSQRPVGQAGQNFFSIRDRKGRGLLNADDGFLYAGGRKAVDMALIAKGGRPNIHLCAVLQHLTKRAID